MQVYRGAPLERVRAEYVERPADSEDIDNQVPQALKHFKVELRPSDKHRARGANQYGERMFRQRLDPARGSEFVIAVRNSSKWGLAGNLQRYALAVALEREEGHGALYAELRAQLDVLAEIELEVE